MKSNNSDRPLGFWSATGAVIATMIGAGIFGATGGFAHELGTDGNVLLVWLLRNADGKVFVELALMLELLSSPEPLEAYTDDKTFLTVTQEVDKFQEDSIDELLDFIEIKHVRTLEEHAGRTNSKLQAAIDKILRSVPREE